MHAACWYWLTVIILCGKTQLKKNIMNEQWTSNNTDWLTEISSKQDIQLHATKLRTIIDEKVYTIDSLQILLLHTSWILNAERHWKCENL